MLKRHSLAFLLSLLSCFFCLDSLFWHGLANLNLVISTQHRYSAQIVFDMHEFKLFPFIHALRYHHVFGIKWKKRNCSWKWSIQFVSSLRGNEDISLIKRVSFLLGRTVEWFFNKESSVWIIRAPGMYLSHFPCVLHIENTSNGLYFKKVVCLHTGGCQRHDVLCQSASCFPWFLMTHICITCVVICVATAYFMSLALTNDAIRHKACFLNRHH